MKKYLLFFGYLVLVASMFFAIDVCAGLFFDRYFFINYDAKLKYVYEGGGGEDIIILGASRAQHHYVPTVFEEELGLTCFNYGIDGRNIFNQYVIAREIVDKSVKKPQLIILELASIDIENTPGWNGEKLSNLYVLYNKSQYVKDVVDSQDKKTGFALRASNLFRYNSLLITFVKTMFLGNAQLGDDKGYVELNTEWKNDIATIENSDKLLAYPQKEEYLKKLIEVCLESNVNLIVCNSPSYEKHRYPEQWIDRAKSICDDYKVPFFDYSLDSVFMSHREWFDDPIHLNGRGSKYYSVIIAGRIDSLINNKGDNY